MTILNSFGMKLILPKLVVGDSAYVAEIPEFAPKTILLDFYLNICISLKVRLPFLNQL